MTAVHFADDLVTLYHGDCLDVLRSIPDGSVDAVVTDPPYALNFMGQAWDSFATSEFVAACEECGNDEPTEGYRYCTDCMEWLDEEALRGAPMLGHQSQNWHEKATHSRGYADNNSVALASTCLCSRGGGIYSPSVEPVPDAGFEVRDSDRLAVRLRVPEVAGRVQGHRQGGRSGA